MRTSRFFASILFFATFFSASLKASFRPITLSDRTDTERSDETSFYLTETVPSSDVIRPDFASQKTKCPAWNLSTRTERASRKVSLESVSTRKLLDYCFSKLRTKKDIDDFTAKLEKLPRGNERKLRESLIQHLSNMKHPWA